MSDKWARLRDGIDEMLNMDKKELKRWVDQTLNEEEEDKMEVGISKDTIKAVKDALEPHISTMKINKGEVDLDNLAKALIDEVTGGKGIGLYGKYHVEKFATGETVKDCFVLTPSKDKASLEALKRYAEVTDNALLAEEIMEWVEEVELRTDYDY